MDLNKIKNEIRKEISMWVGDKQKLTASFVKERSTMYFNHMAEQGKYTELTKADKDKIINSLCADYLGLGPLQPLMEDPDITEIMINGPFQIFIEKNGHKGVCDVKFDNEQHLKYIVEKMISPSGKRVDESYPYVDFALENGSRVNVILPPLSVGGATVTIRKFLTSIHVVQTSTDDAIATKIVNSIKNLNL